MLFPDVTHSQSHSNLHIITNLIVHSFVRTITKTQKKCQRIQFYSRTHTQTYSPGHHRTTHINHQRHQWRTMHLNMTWHIRGAANWNWRAMHFTPICTMQVQSVCRHRIDHPEPFDIQPCTVCVYVGPFSRVVVDVVATSLTYIYIYILDI